MIKTNAIIDSELALRIREMICDHIVADHRLSDCYIDVNHLFVTSILSIYIDNEQLPIAKLHMIVTTNCKIIRISDGHSKYHTQFVNIADPDMIDKIIEIVVKRIFVEL